MKKYKVRDPRCGIDKKYVQVYGQELENIKKRRKTLTAKVIVEEAKTIDNPLHDYFDWNNNVAGEKWRLQQARNLIGNIVETVIVEGKATLQRSFFNVSDRANEAVYVTIAEVKSNNNYRLKILSDIINHLENTTTLMKMFKEIEK